LAESGDRLALDRDTFRQKAAQYPRLEPLRALRDVLSGMRLADYTVGRDGRNRVHLGPFGSVTARNQPSNSRFIYGGSRWVRSFIKPGPGRFVIYSDWEAQEYAISAALSGDEAMWAAYDSGDPYLDFAVRVGLIPPEADPKRLGRDGVKAAKEKYKAQRQRCKAIVLGINYGRGGESIAHETGMPLCEAKELLQRHREIYRDYWRFVRNVQDAACLGLPVRTPFDWVRQVKPGIQAINRRSFQNWPAQACGAEMMRLAACELTESGIAVCSPIHDAFLVEGVIADMEPTIDRTVRIMQSASEAVLGEGRVVRVGVEVVPHPDRFVDNTGAADFFRTVMDLARQLEDEEGS
jgi:hypothetical protein